MFKITSKLGQQALTALSVIVLIALVMLSMPSAWARGENAPRATTQSPYFYIPGGQAGVDELPLKNTDVDVNISGVIADVTIVQYYRNEGSRPIEAKYVFPGSTRAAVYAMNVKLGDRLITANIREKQQARVEYQEARSEGRTAALLEEHLPNVFQMNVANIMPGDEVRVELHYTELLIPQAGNYQFVFPMVVGPRYNSPGAQTERSRNTAQAVSNPYLHAEEPNSATFDIKVHMTSPVGIKTITSTTHALLVNKEEGNKRALINVEKGFGISNRDFILDYQLAGVAIESGIMIYQGAEENFFLAMVQPPKAVSPEILPPRDYIFVVDTSGSMKGFPLNTAKQVLTELMQGMRPVDTFNIMLFSGSSSTLSPRSVSATQVNITHALEMISKTYYGSGNTELIPALRHVFSLPKAPEISRTVVILTDGYVSVESEAFALVRQNLDKANVFAFGIGSSVNRHLIEGLARAGMGEPFIVTKPEEAQQQAATFHRMIASPVLTSVKASFQNFDAYDVDPVKLPDVLGERPVIVFGKWRGATNGSIVIEGRSANGPYRQVLPVNAQVNQDTAALRYLWARSRIDSLMDQENLTGTHMYQDQITSLGLKYNLLTAYTSFIAVDKVVRNHNTGNTPQVNQPSPMPQGVSDLAIGSEVPSTPEPAAWGAMILVGSMLAMVARHQRRRKDRLTS